MFSPLPYGIPPPVSLPFVEKVVSTLVRHRRGAVLSLLLLLLSSMAGYYVLQRATQLNAVLYGPEMKSVKALALYELGAYSRAADQYRKDYAAYLQTQENVPPHHLSLLRCDIEGTTQWAEQELRRHPDSIEALLAMARAAYDSRNYTMAALYTRRGLTLYWDNTDALLLAALIATRDPTQGDAFHYLDVALRTGTAARNLMSFINVLEITGHLQSQHRSERPYGLLTLYYRVLTIYDTGMANRVMYTARRAIERNDHSGEALFSIGLMFEKMGKPHKALDAYEEAVRANPRQAIAYAGAARLYAKRNDPLHEYLFLKKAFEASPTDRFHFSALYYHFSGKLDWYAIIRSMEKVLTIDPGNVTAHIHLAWALETSGESYQSKQVIKQMLTLEAHSPQELESKSWAARRVGDDGQGESLLHRSILLDRGRAEPHRELAKLYKRQNRVSEALGEFEIALQMGAYENPNEWQEYCALYRSANQPQVCAQGNGSSVRTNRMM